MKQVFWVQVVVGSRVVVSTVFRPVRCPRNHVQVVQVIVIVTVTVTVCVIVTVAIASAALVC